MGRTRVVRRDRRPEGSAALRADGSPPMPLSPQGVLELQRSMGNHAVQRVLTASRPVLQRMPYIVQAGYMSGDMFGISAALVLNPSCGVLILQETKAELAAKREPDQGALFKSFYEKSLGNHGVRPEVIAKRVKMIGVNDARAVHHDLTNSASAGTHARAVRTAASLTGRDYFVAPGNATTYVGSAYAEAGTRGEVDKTRGEVEKAWTAGPGPTDAQLLALLQGKNIVPGRRYALLWVRLSAKLKKGGAHSELDTSLQGVRDLKREIRAQTAREVVLVGDDPGKAEFLSDAVNMLEFWNQPPFSTYTGVDKRMAQLRLYSYMVNNNYDIVSVGMRSGAMEGPALLGVPTVYIEDLENKQQERMQKWIGKVPDWTQVQVETLPTRTGRRYQAAAARRPQVSAPDLRKAVNNATLQINKHTGQESSTELVNSYHPAIETFQKDYITASLEAWRADLPGGVRDYDTYVSQYEDRDGKTWSTELRSLLTTWHAQYRRWIAVDAALRAQENTIAAATAGSDAVEVRRDLESIPTATSLHHGLADFINDAGVKLGIDTTEPATKAALRRWRSLWTGKSELVKGFEGADIEKILSTPKLQADRIDRLTSDLAGLMGTPLDVTAATVKRLRAQPDRLTLTQFTEKLVFGLRKSLSTRLGVGKNAKGTTVQNAWTRYVATEDGRAWWTAVEPKLTRLHKLAFP